MAVADGEWDEDGVGLAGGHGWKSPGGKCKSPCGEGLWGGEKKPLSRWVISGTPAYGAIQRHQDRCLDLEYLASPDGRP